VAAAVAAHSDYVFFARYKYSYLLTLLTVKMMTMMPVVMVMSYLARELQLCDAV